MQVTPQPMKMLEISQSLKGVRCEWLTALKKHCWKMTKKSVLTWVNFTAKLYSTSLLTSTKRSYSFGVHDLKSRKLPILPTAHTYSPESANRIVLDWLHPFWLAGQWFNIRRGCDKACDVLLLSSQLFPLVSLRKTPSTDRLSAFLSVAMGDCEEPRCPMSGGCPLMGNNHKDEKEKENGMTYGDILQVSVDDLRFWIQHFITW